MGDNDNVKDELEGGEESEETKKADSKFKMARMATVGDGETKRVIRVQAVSKASGVILALALGVHSFFEGIAFGLQSEVGSAGQLATGILIHKGAAVVSLGGAFARTGYSMKSICLFLGVFSLTAPLGIIIGIVVSESNKLVDVVFLSISGGTFLYVACSEIIVNEFSRGQYRWAKVLFIVLGIAVISLLWLIEGEHNHGPACDPHAGH